MKELRNELASQIRELETPSQSLYAAYVSTDVDPVDVENILLYNVGCSAFSHLSGRGIQFERGFHQPPRDLTGVSWPHYSLYSTSEPREFRFWEAAELAASWRGAKCLHLSASTKLVDVWRAVKRSSVEVAKAIPGTRFGINVQITPPESHRMGFVGVVKPLLDGIVSAFHSHDGTDLPELALRLAGAEVSPKETADLLTETRLDVLGRRPLLRKRKRMGSVQWNPSDDACVAVRVTRGRGPTADGGWEFAGELFAVRPLTGQSEQGTGTGGPSINAKR